MNAKKSTRLTRYTYDYRFQARNFEFYINDVLVVGGNLRLQFNQLLGERLDGVVTVIQTLLMSNNVGLVLIATEIGGSEKQGTKSIVC